MNYVIDSCYPGKMDAYSSQANSAILSNTASPFPTFLIVVRIPRESVIDMKMFSKKAFEMILYTSPGLCIDNANVLSVINGSQHYYDVVTSWKLTPNKLLKNKVGVLNDTFLYCKDYFLRKIFKTLRLS